MTEITVHLDTYASEQEAQAIHEALISTGATNIEVKRDYKRTAGADGLLPWTVIVIAPFSLLAYGFFTQLGKNAADRIYPTLEREVGIKLKALMKKMSDARNQRYGMQIPGNILLEDTISGATVVIDIGVPDSAYHALSQVNLSSFGPTYVWYNHDTQEWTTNDQENSRQAFS
jgi:hypothetical protein